MGLGFGLLSAQLRPGESDWTRAYDETVRLAVDAEKLGFDSVWTTEHHFVDDGYMPSLAVTSAAIAAATSEIEIGTGVLLAPLHHPLRIAEDAATVSLLSGGRFILGLGLGWSDVEYRALGVDRTKRGAAMEEILGILPKAFSGEPFRHEGQVYDLPEVGVRPTPSSKIPILVGGGAEAAIRRAARLADGIFANVPRDAFLQQVEWIEDECEKIGRDPSELRIVHYSVMLPGENEQAAMDHYLDHVWQMYWKYSDMEASATRSRPPTAAPPFDPSRRDSLYGRSTVTGTSEQIVDYLNGIREAAGRQVEFAARSYFPPRRTAQSKRPGGHHSALQHVASTTTAYSPVEKTRRPPLRATTRRVYRHSTQPSRRSPAGTTSALQHVASTATACSVPRTGPSLRITYQIVTETGPFILRR